MNLMDSRGRLGGRVSLVDLLAVLLLLVLLVPPIVLAYNALGLSEIELSAVEPTRLVVGEHRRIRIHGSGFRKDSVVKLSALNLGKPAQVSLSSIEADIPENLPPGWYHPIVVGPRNSSAAIFPIFVVWKPEVLSVSPAIVEGGEEVTLEISGRRFLPDAAVSLGGVALPHVEHVNDSLLRVRLGRGEVLPGSHSLKVVNRTGGEEFQFSQPIHVEGKKGVPLQVTLRVESQPPAQLEHLRKVSTGEEPIVNPDSVHYVHLLSSSAGVINIKNPQWITVYVNVGIDGTIAYEKDGYVFYYSAADPDNPHGGEQSIRSGQRLSLKVNGKVLRGVVVGKPIIRDRRYALSWK